MMNICHYYVLSLMASCLVIRASSEDPMRIVEPPSIFNLQEDPYLKEEAAAYKNAETLPFTAVLIGNSGVERRTYPEVSWACIKNEFADNLGGIVDMTQHIMFGPLFNYINGENDQKAKIGMTIPVTIEVPMENRHKRGSDFEMCFCISSDFQDNPPKPTYKRIVIKKKKMKVYTKTKPMGQPRPRPEVGGRILAADWINEAMDIKNKLKEMDIPLKFDRFLMASYDSVTKKKNLRNEVWYPMEE